MWTNVRTLMVLCAWKSSTRPWPASKRQKPAKAMQPSRVLLFRTTMPGFVDSPEPAPSARRQRAKSDVLWMNVFSFEMLTLPKPVVASQPAFAL